MGMIGLDNLYPLKSAYQVRTDLVKNVQKTKCKQSRKGKISLLR